LSRSSSSMELTPPWSASPSPSASIIIPYFIFFCRYATPLSLFLSFSLSLSRSLALRASRCWSPECADDPRDYLSIQYIFVFSTVACGNAQVVS
jgi:hypothetical protein